MTTTAQLSPGQARIVDPILSEHARGYRQAGLVGRSLFPLAPVPMYGGKVIQFGKEAFRAVNTARAPGTATKRIQFGYEGEPYAIQPNALESPVPRELMRDASQVPGIDLGTRAVNLVLRVMNLGHELKCASIARNAANYDANHKLALAGTSTWTGAASTPIDDVLAGREAIRESVGIYPNTAIVSAQAMSALKTNPQILDRTKYTSRDSVTAAILSALWEVPNVVEASAVSADPNTDAFGDIWGADVILGYVAPSGGGDASANAEEPSYAYTYLIDGMPMVEVPYWDPNTKSWIYGVSFDYTPVLSGMQAGFLIQGAGTKQ
jgi:hypothetical protein